MTTYQHTAVRPTRAPTPTHPHTPNNSGFDQAVALIAEKLQAAKGGVTPEATRRIAVEAITDHVQPLFREAATRFTAHGEALGLLAEGLKRMDEKLDSLPLTGTITVATRDGLSLGTVEGHVRREFEAVCRTVAAGVPVMLVGPSGSGKTHLAAQIAQSLGLRFSLLSLTAGVTESRLYGRFVPTGENGSFQYVEAEFVKFYRDGGLFLLDEVDAADPNVLLALNAAIANRTLETPNPDCPIVPMHADFRIVTAANTYGHGADRTYCGRNQLDGATLDRFCCGKFEITYDEAFERAVGDAGLVKWVHALRREINRRGLRRTASTRLVLDGTVLLKAGFTVDDVKQRYFLDWPRNERDMVEYL